MDKRIEKHEDTKPKNPKSADGRPGDKPRWTSGAKTFVGTSASSRSRIWFTVGQGTLNEIYFPDIDQANTRSVRFLITDSKEFFSDEAWDAEHTVTWMAPGVPGCSIESRCKAGRYSLMKEIITDPLRDTLIMRVHFQPNQGDAELRIYLYVEPHMGDQGAGNDGWVGQYKGEKMLFAQRASTDLAVVSRPPMLTASCGYVGTSDGYTQLSSDGVLADCNLAEKGNIALTAEINPGDDLRFVVSLGYGSDPAEAAQQARAGVLEEFDKTKALFIQQWQEKQREYADIADQSGHALDIYRVSTAVLETHQSKRFPGAFVASLSLPWGFDRSDKDVGGYHVLWPRDMVETAMGKLASGDARSARWALFYLSCTQDTEGGWSQNMWLDGTPHGDAIQMDGMALPILLADKLRRENALDGYDAAPIVDGASRFLLLHGPVTQQGRWETTPGYSPYTMGTQVAALLAAADFAETAGRASEAEFLCQTADAWNDAIDELTYAEGTPLAKTHGVSGYYMRMTPPERIERENVDSLTIFMPNLHFGSKHQNAIEIISPDALALVRFGLRSPDDPRILSTIKVIDATLKRDTSTGPVWIRSTKDGYGERADGSPFDKTGIGRGWPLLAGERAHYEIAAGNHAFALELLRAMARQTSYGGMIPEQVWDAADIPERFLFNGHPTGSGMPLVWAHSEYIKLLRSLESRAIWDLPPQPVERYVRARKSANFQIWSDKQRRGWLSEGKNLRLDLLQQSMVRWTVPGSQPCEAATVDSGLGIHSLSLPLASVPPGYAIEIEVTPVSHAVDGHLKNTAFRVHVRKSA